MREQLKKWQEEDQEIIVIKKDGEKREGWYIESFDDLGIIIKPRKNKPVSIDPSNPVTVIPWTNIDSICITEQICS